MIRAVTNYPKSYRLASTGPYYVEIGGKLRISKTSSQFFIDWLKERQAKIKLAPGAQRDEVMQYYVGAQKYWESVLQATNAE